MNMRGYEAVLIFLETDETGWFVSISFHRFNYDAFSVCLGDLYICS